MMLQTISEQYRSGGGPIDPPPDPLHNLLAIVIGLAIIYLFWFRPWYRQRRTC